MKKVFVGVGLLVLVFASVAGGVFYLAFGRNQPIVDGEMLAPGVQVLDEGLLTVFVVDLGPEKVALVDAGKDESGKSILAALARRHLGPEAVTAILLTHGHPDHIAACRQFPGAEVYAMDTENVGGVAVTHPLHDGDIVDLNGVRVEAFALPGHTPGSAAYLTRGVLFLGDSARGLKDGTLRPAIRALSMNTGQNVASLKALATRLAPRGAEVHKLAFGHSGPLNGVGPLLAFAKGH